MSLFALLAIQFLIEGMFYVLRLLLLANEVSHGA